MNSAERQNYIFQNLYRSKSYRTVAYFSERLSVSNRTIYKDIEKLSKSLESDQIKILTCPGKGFYLEGKETVENISLIEIDKSKNNIFSLENRKKWILKEIFLKGEPVSYNQLSQKYLVSKSSVVNDMRSLEDEIKEYNLKFSYDNKGTVVKGDEREIQLFLIKKLSNYSSVYSGIQIEKKLKKEYVDFFEEDTIDFVLKKVMELNLKLKKEISDNYLLYLIIAILVEMKRVSLGFHISRKKELLVDEVENLKIYTLTAEFVKKIEEEFNISFNDNDIAYLNNQFVAHGVTPALSEEKTEYNQLIDESIKNMSDIMQVDFSKDIFLKEGIMFHFLPMIYRLKMGVRIQNPLLNELKQQYKLIFNATWYVFSTLMNNEELPISEDEVSFLMVHFQAAVERNTQASRILVLCPTGIGTSELVVNRIRNILPKYVILEVTNISDFLLRDLHNIDLIILTIEIENPSKPIIYVSPLVTREEQNEIFKYYTKSINEQTILLNQQENNNGFSSLISVTSEKSIYLNKQYKDKNEALTAITNDFFDRGLVNSECLQSIFEREEMGETSLSMGIAIPHCDMKKVLKSQIGIVTLKNNIVWGNKMVDMFFLICFSESDITRVKDVLKNIYAIIESESDRNRIKKMNHPSQLISFLGGKSIDK